MTEEYNPIILTINAIIEDMEERILPGCDGITQKDIFGVMHTEFGNVIDALNELPSSSSLVFTAVHVIHALIHVMSVDTRVTIEDPAGFYRTAMKALLSELNRMKEEIIHVKSECDTCADRTTCSEDRARQAKGAGPWGTRNVH